MAANIPSYTLNNGTKIPSVGMGCWMGSPGGGERVYEMCTNALKAGYRHFDTASGYANEKEVGRAIRDSGIPRNEIYVTTKLPNDMHHAVAEALEKSLKELDFDYVDLYLVHWPQASLHGKSIQPEQSPTCVETWKQMENLLDTGKVKSIGVSNFGVPLLKNLLTEATVVPATNQVEIHPCLPVHELKAFCEEKGIILTAYSPLGQPTPNTQHGLLDNEVITSIAQRLGVSPGQVALSWGVQRGTVVVPKSENPQRMKDNITLVTLTSEDMAAIDSIHKQPGMHKSLLTYHSDDGTVFGWTYEQLGWNMTQGGLVPS